MPSQTSKADKTRSGFDTHPGKEEVKMNICIPVTEDKGVESPVCAHFGSAPIFMIVDTESGNCRAIQNRNQDHAHGMCQPLMSLAHERVDGMLVGGIGMGALNKLQASNIRVFLAKLPTVKEAVAAFKAGTLQEVTPAEACGHHGHGPQGHGQGRTGSHGPCGGHS
jgi:predicted Fe-Mo cluster-binding NifX family protein